MNISKTSNIIVWQKWLDPFGHDDLSSLENTISHDDNDQEDYIDNNSSIKNGALKAILTPMGLIPYTENTASSKIFNFWVGHTNFNLSKKVIDVIENSDGVETLDIFTRYRFRIAIGKVFEDAKVMTNINERVYDHLDQET